MKLPPELVVTRRITFIVKFKFQPIKESVRHCLSHLGRMRSTTIQDNRSELQVTSNQGLI